MDYQDYVDFKESTIDVARIVRRLLLHWKLIIAFTIVATVIGIVVTIPNKPNEYLATASAYSIAAGSYTDSIQGSKAMKDYAEIITSNKVAERVATALTKYRLTTTMIQKMITTSSSENSTIFHIVATAEDPQLAVDVVNAVTDAFLLEVRNITGQDSVQILDHAANVTLSYNANMQKLKTRLIFGAAGFVLICAVLIVGELFSTNIKEVEDGTLDGEITLFGVIPKHDI